MNKKNTALEKMNLINTDYVEQAVYSASRKKISFRKSGIVAACLAICTTLSVTAYASGSLDAVRSYFLGDNEKMQEMVLSGNQISKNENGSVRLENFIADDRTCWFTVSFIDFSHQIKTNSGFDVFWIDESGNENRNFDKEIGACTENFKKGFSLSADAKSMYADADATLIFGCYAPDNMNTQDFKMIKVEYEGLSLEIKPEDAIVDMYSLTPVTSDDSIRDFKVSQIGFYFEAAPGIDRFNLAMINENGEYIQVDQGDFHGYHMSNSTESETKWMPVIGNWNGESAVSIGILDLDKYKGIQLNGTDYLFER